MAGRKATSDLVPHSRLDTVFGGDDDGDGATEVVRHMFVTSDRRARQRRLKTAETWTQVRELGNGTFGRVVLQDCVDGPHKGQVRAVKEISKKADGGMAKIDYNTELEAIAKFSHSRYEACFVRSDGWYENSTSVFITMEYLDHGDLQKYLSKPVPETEARDICAQLVEGIAFMHENRYAHRDLKPGNVLVVEPGPNWWVKIADFGISKRAEEATAFHTLIGTKGYLAPELTELRRAFATEEENAAGDKQSYTYAVDIWALGQINFRMITKKLAFFEPSTGNLFDYVVQGGVFPRYALEKFKASPECCDFIEKTMVARPSGRITAKAALDHDWIAEPKSLSRANSLAQKQQWLPTTSIDEAGAPEYDDVASASWETEALQPTDLLTDATQQLSIVPGEEDFKTAVQAKEPAPELHDKFLDSSKLKNKEPAPQDAPSVEPNRGPLFLSRHTALPEVESGTEIDELASAAWATDPPVIQETLPVQKSAVSAPITSTPTKNKLSLAEPYTFAGVEADDLMLTACLAASRKKNAMDAIDEAFRNSLRYYPRAERALSVYTVKDFYPYEPVSRMAAAVVESPSGEVITCVKGAPTSVLKMVEEDHPIHEDDERAYKIKLADFTTRGFRSVGVARRRGEGWWEILGIVPYSHSLRHESPKTRDLYPGSPSAEANAPVSPPAEPSYLPVIVSDGFSSPGPASSQPDLGGQIKREIVTPPGIHSRHASSSSTKGADGSYNGRFQQLPKPFDQKSEDSPAGTFVSTPTDGVVEVRAEPNNDRMAPYRGQPQAPTRAELHLPVDHTREATKPVEPFLVRALKGYSALLNGDGEEMGFEPGQIINVTGEKIYSRYYRGEYDANGSIFVGTFPKNIVERYRPEHTPAVSLVGIPPAPNRPPPSPYSGTQPPFRAVALYSYSPSGDFDYLTFRAGQIITITGFRYEWAFGNYTDKEGRRHKGRFHRDCVTVYEPLYSATVVDAFDSTELGSLSLSVGQVVDVLDTKSPAWWYGTRTEDGGESVSGFFPPNKVSRLDTDMPTSTGPSTEASTAASISGAIERRSSPTLAVSPDLFVYLPHQRFRALKAYFPDDSPKQGGVGELHFRAGQVITVTGKNDAVSKYTGFYYENGNLSKEIRGRFPMDLAEQYNDTPARKVLGAPLPPFWVRAKDLYIPQHGEKGRELEIHHGLVIKVTDALPYSNLYYGYSLNVMGNKQEGYFRKQLVEPIPRPEFWGVKPGPLTMEEMGIPKPEKEGDCVVM